MIVKDRFYKEKSDIKAVRQFSIFIFLVCGLFFFGCGRQNIKSTANPREESADRIMFDAKIDFSEEGRPTGKLNAEKLLFFEKDGKTFGYRLKVDFFGSDGKNAARLVADSGLVMNETQRLTVYGNVHLITENGVELWSESLAYFPDIQRIKTEAGIKIDRRGEFITGRGLDSDLELKDIRIERNVTGRLRQD